MTGQNRVIALRYAQHRGKRREYFHGHAGEPWTDPVDLGYYIWVIDGAEGRIVVDTGFSPEVAVRRKRVGYERTPGEALAALGVDPASIDLVVITHLHYDHAGSLDLFPNARFVLQESEYHFWTGRYASRHELAKHVERADIERVVAASLDGRIDFVDGSAVVRPGVAVHLVGGHTPGTQVVTVETAEGLLVLGGDATHLDDHHRGDHPAAVFTDLPGMYRAFDAMRELAGGEARRIIPGHDPALVESLDPLPGVESWGGVVTLASRP